MAMHDDPMIPRVAGVPDEVHERLSVVDDDATKRKNYTRRLNLWTALVVLISFASACVVVFIAKDTGNDTAAIKAGDEVAGCRSTIRSGLDDANLDYLTTDGTLDLILFDAIVARSQGRDDIVMQLAAQALPARQAKADALMHVREATEAYAAAASLSLVDPDTFIQQCRENNP